MGAQPRAYDFWPGLRARFEVRFRTSSGTIMIGPAEDAFLGLSYGKSMARQELKAGNRQRIVAVEVTDIDGFLVLGESAEAFGDCAM